jgi:Sulfotransferase domain
MEAGVVARGELIVDDERALAAGGEASVEDVLLIPGLEDQGVGGDSLGQGHARLPGDSGHGGPPGLALRLRSVFPGREGFRVATAMSFVRSACEVIDTGHILMMAEGGANRSCPAAPKAVGAKKRLVTPPAARYARLVTSLPVRYRSAEEDSARWIGFPFREGDIVISTRSKTGTTWVQMICALLIFRTPELPEPLGQLSPWLDHLITPREEVYARLASQRHRRFVKTHTPLDGIPLDPRATYIVTARHPLDMAVSCITRATTSTGHGYTS